MKDLRFDQLGTLSVMLLAENRRQIEKWGIQDKDPMEWMCFITEEVGELAAAIADYKYGRGPRQDIIKEAIQAATLCLKIAEMHLDHS